MQANNIILNAEGIETEPNDVFENAVLTELSSQNPGVFGVTGTIGDNTELSVSGLDVDLYRVQLDAGHLLTATIDTIDLESPIDSSILRVFDNKGNEFLIEPFFSEQLSNGETGIEFIADTSATYFIGASGFGNEEYNPIRAGSGGFGKQGDYNLSLEVTPRETTTETNDTIPNAIVLDEELISEGFSTSEFIGDNQNLNNPKLDVDLYRISLSEGESIGIDIDTPDTSDLQLILRVFNSNGGGVAFSNDSLGTGGVESSDPFLNFTAPASDEYYIGVSDFNNDFYSAFTAETGNAPGATGSYNIEITSTDVEFEASEEPTNETLQTATALELGSGLSGVAVVDGKIGDHPDFTTVPGLDIDLYQVELEENEQIGIEVAAQAINSPLDAILRVFDSEGQQIAFNDDFRSRDPVIGLTVAEEGTYYLGISGVGNNDYNPREAGTGSEPFASTGEYSLTIFSFGEVEIEEGPEERNDTINTATETELSPDRLGSFRTEAFIGNNNDPNLSDFSLDVDLFKVELAADSLLTADINTADLELRSQLDSVIQIFNGDGDLITFNDDENGNTSDSFIEFTPEEFGTYYLGISGLGNNGDPQAENPEQAGYDPTVAGSGIPGASTGGYILELFLENVPVEDPTNDTIDGVVITGLNRDSAGSVTESGIVGDNLELAADSLDVDLYQVELQIGDELSVNVAAAVLESELDAYLRIFNAEGEEVAFDDDSGEFSDSQLTFIPKTNGTFYVGVSGFGNINYDETTAGSGSEAGSTGEYELTLNLTPGTPVEAVADELSTNESIVLESNLLSNDSGEDLVITAVNESTDDLGVELTTDQGALLTVNEDGSFSYNPNGQFDDLENGETETDSFSYTVTDAVGQTAQTTATLTILGVTPEAVVDAIADELTTEEQTVVESNLLDNDTPAEALSVTAVNGNADNLATETTTRNGAIITLTEEGNLVYDPNGQFDELNQGQTATDSFTYSVTDNQGNTDQTTVTINIEGVTQFEEVRPTANNDIALTASGGTVTIDVLANDTANDQFGDLEIGDFQTSTTKGGTITLDESGEKLVYTADSDFSGEDSFTYTIANESSGIDQGTVNLTVNPSDPNVNVELELRELDQEPGLIIGEEFLVDVRFRDLLTENNSGEAVVSGYADIVFDPTRLQIIENDPEQDDDGFAVDGIIHAEDFNGFRKGTVNNVEGIVDETGGFFPGAAPGNLPDDNTVFTLHMKATGGGDARIMGTTALASNAGEANNSAITIISQLADQRSQTNFGGLEIESLTSNITAMEISTRFEDLEGNPIEKINVNEEFNIVLAAKDLRSEGDKLGVFSAFADVNYDTILADVTNVEPVEPFASPVIDLNQAINDDEGLLNDIGGTKSSFTPIPANNSPQDFAIITATAKAQGDFEVTTDVGDEITSLNTLFGLDNDVNSGTRYFGNTLTIEQDTTNPVGTPDLVIKEFDALIDHVLGGETTVNLTIANEGDAASSGFQVEVLYYTADSIDQLSEEEPQVLKTLAFDELEAEGNVNEQSEVSLPVETLLAEALEDDPSVFGQPRPIDDNGEEGFFESNNIDYLGVRIVNSESSGEEEEAFANNALNDTEGVNIDDIAFFPWDFVNSGEEGVSENQEDELVSDKIVDFNDANAVFRNIGEVITEEVTEGNRFGLDLDRIDFDLDGAISPVDAVRVANRIGYEINPAIIEESVG